MMDLEEATRALRSLTRLDDALKTENPELQELIEKAKVQLQLIIDNHIETEYIKQDLNHIDECITMVMHVVPREPVSDAEKPSWFGRIFGRSQTPGRKLRKELGQ